MGPIGQIQQKMPDCKVIEVAFPLGQGWAYRQQFLDKIIRLLETFFIHQSVTDSKRMPKTSHPSQTHCVTTKKQKRKSAHGGTRYRKEWTIEMRNVHRLPEVTKGMGSYLSINRGRKAHPSIY